VIARALAPIWEANHVWLIVVVVLFFVGFPPVFAIVSLALHVPLVIMLIGITLRGCAFVFRAYGGHPGGEKRTLGWVFAVSSLITPLMLGMTLAAFSAADDERWGAAAMLLGWITPYTVLVGVLVVIAFALLAAVYLTHETDVAELRDDFRRNAMISAALLPIAAWAALWAARAEAPRVWEALSGSSWAILFHVVTGAVGGLTMFALWKRRFGSARIAAVGLMVLLVAGWAAAQHPWLLYPRYTIEQAAAPAHVLRPVLWVLAAGALLVLPGFLYLYRVFKSRDARSGT
jgi:cytochrome d ubiquinol oxidase subunit II